MPQSLRFTRAGGVLEAPKAATFRVFIEGGAEQGYAISPEGFKIIAADREQRQVFIDSAGDFREWLNIWRFIPTGQPPRLLGPSMWEAQRLFAAATVEHESIQNLKSRQLGMSVVAVAYCGWRLRFGPTNCRVSILAQTDENSKGFLADVMYGLDHLPPALRLPSRALEHTASLDAGKGDTRRIRSFPASNAIRSGSFNHVMLDEAAAMIDFRKVWRATEEAIVPGGTCHLLSTGGGGASDFDELWRKSREGESRFHPLFLHALLRDDRTPEWYEAKRRTTDLQSLRQELPMSEEDALAGHGEFLFTAEDLDHCGSFLRLGLRPYEQGRRYLIACDPSGGGKDATCIIVLDCTGDRRIGAVRPAVYVTDFKFMPGATVSEAERAIEQVARDFPLAPVVIETNGVGNGIPDHLRISSQRIHSYNTGTLSKKHALSTLALAVQQKEVAWDATAVPELDRQMRSYKTPDENINKTDAVSALWIAVDSLDLAYEPSAGRILGVIRV